MKKNDYYHSPFSERKVVNILSEEIDQIPSILKCIISLNANRYVGTSKVCGTITGNNFELRNRRDVFFSIRAVGSIIAEKSGSTIEIRWVYPKFPDIFSVVFLRRYAIDKDVILGFLREFLRICNREK